MQNKEFFKPFVEIFLKQNAKLNLVSKNDAKLLWEKHIADSLAFEQFMEKYRTGTTLLDIGTGGGFPAIPIALAYPKLEVFALDSIRKKINAVEEIKTELSVKNLHPLCGRAENLEQKFDIITSRAVAPLKIITGYALPLLNKDGYFIAYKSLKSDDEIIDAKDVLKKYSAEVIDIIEYKLPLEENYQRKLIVIKV